MNQQWSQLNKEMQECLKRRESFDSGIAALLALRESLMAQIMEFRELLTAEEFCAMPFPNAKGYHSKTAAYSLFHVFRIEDIVANSLIRKTEQVFLSGEWQRKMNSPIATTGNELEGEQIVQFSAMLDIDALYGYIKAVDESTAALVEGFSFDDMKTRMTPADGEYLRSLGSVSEAESACWLVDYWCGKDIKGLVQMPFSRHWIMHVEAGVRIMNRILAKRK